MKTVKDLLAEANAQITVYEVGDANDMLGREDVVFVDVRDEPELGGGKIPGAVHASRGMLEFHLDRASPTTRVSSEDKAFVFYCKSGGRSALAAQRAEEMRLKRVASLSGGFSARQERGGPVEKA